MRHRVSTTLSPDERVRIEAAFKPLGMDMTTFLRWAAISWATQIAASEAQRTSPRVARSGE